jgi:uncharacterized repeat protein (TIGR01451 family)
MHAVLDRSIRWLPVGAALTLAACGCVTYPQSPCAPVVTSGPLMPMADPLASGAAGPAPIFDPSASSPPPTVDPVPSAPVIPGAPVVRLRSTAPAQAAVGDNLTLRIEVSNSGGSVARGVVVTEELPAGLTLVGSTPRAVVTGSKLEWRLGDLAAGQTQIIELNTVVARAGIIDQCPRIVSADGQSATDCARTTVPTAQAASATLETRVTGPRDAIVGQEVTFEATVTNRGNSVARELLAQASFDAGLEHEVATSPIERNLDDLAPGASQTFAVTFKVTLPGRLCIRLEVFGEGGARSSAQACVNATAPAATRPAPTRPNPPSTTQPAPPVIPPADRGRQDISVEIEGPEAKNIGEAASFAMNVINTGTLPLTNVTIVADFDRELEPESATSGHNKDAAGRLTWSFTRLEAGKRLLLEAVCRCKEASNRACVSVSAASAERVEDRGEACVRIGSAATDLTVSVIEFNDPVTVGKEVSYEIRVRNVGQTTDRQVTVEFTLPKGLAIIPLGTAGPTGSGKFTEIRASTYQFPPVAELKPTESLTFRVRARAEQAGDGVFRARVDSQGLVQPATDEETLSILAP